MVATIGILCVCVALAAAVLIVEHCDDESRRE